jgi:nucleotide-binding universal stress UspA family protein
MEKLERPIIVPWDFSQVAENAFQHAVNISKVVNREILLLHIVHEERDKDSIAVELKASAEKLGIIMGTHGVKGAQKLFGSKALKVVVSSRIPFLVVQDKPKKNTIDTILLPIDFKRENKEKANWIYYLARNFGAKFIILKSKAKDKGFKRKTLSNIKYVETFLKGHDVQYEIVTASGKQRFKKEIISFAKSHNADLILVMATRDINWTDYLLGAPEQYVLANPENLPIMCMNPRPAKIGSGFRASGGGG